MRTPQFASMLIISPELVEQITYRISLLKKRSKSELFATYQQYERLNMSHVMREPKSTMVSEILENEFGGSRMETYYAIQNAKRHGKRIR